MGYRHAGHRDRHDPKHREHYANMFPNIRKWLNQCIQCQAVGRKKDLPIADPGSGDEHMFYNIRKMWDVLELSESGLCDICERTDNAKMF